jgi:polyphenol oxidase
MVFQKDGLITPSWESSSVFAAFGTTSIFNDREASEIEKTLAGLRVLSDTIVIPKQVHGDHIEVIGKNTEPVVTVEETDGLITAEKNVALTMVTADCIPIIFYDARQNLIGLAHAGWRGTMKNMAAQMVTKMASLGASRDTLRVAIGPCINDCCFEVKQDLFQQFAAAFPGSRSALSNRDEKFFVNLSRITFDQLIDSGVSAEHIDHFPFCTKCDERFFSYRRSNGHEGRQVSVIVLQ